MKKSLLNVLFAGVAASLLILSGCGESAGDSDFDEYGDTTEQSTGGSTGNTTPSTPVAPTTYNELPVVPVGNTKTRIDGAGIMINVDNTALGITGANAASTTLEVSVTDTDSNASVNYQFAQWDDYKGTETVRCYIVLNEAHENLSVEVKAKIDGVWYKNTVKFVNKQYVFDFDVEGIVIKLGADEVKPGANTTISVVDTTYALEQDVTYTISPEGAATIENGVITIAEDATDGDITIIATYSEDITAEATLKVNANALPTLLSISRIDGAGVGLFISKEIVSTVPSKDDVTITGERSSDSDAWKGYAGEVKDIGKNVFEVDDQGDKIRIFFTKDSGFPNGVEITEVFEVKFNNVTINATFEGNALKTSSIVVD